MGRVKRKSPPNMRTMRRFRPPCLCAKYHPGLCSPSIQSVVSNNSVIGQWRPWSDCADAQSDLGLRCPHLPGDTFSHGAAQTMSPTTILVGALRVEESLTSCRCGQKENPDHENSFAESFSDVQVDTHFYISFRTVQCIGDVIKDMSAQHLKCILEDELNIWNTYCKCRRQ